MAGIGFEIRKYLEEDSFIGTFKAYGFAGLIGAGPWILSILGVLLIGLVALWSRDSGVEVQQFTTAVTWMMGASLILTGLLQLVFTRFVADRLYEGHQQLVIPNLLGALLLTTLASGALGLVVAHSLFEESGATEVLMLSNLVVLSNIWIVLIFVAGLRRFQLILYAFAAGYAVTIVLSVLLLPHGLPGLLCGMLVGHALLLFLMLGVVIPEYPFSVAVRMDFLDRRQIFPSLIFIGLFYNLSIWADKLIFWLYPGTSEAVIGPLRSSLIYDVPIFLAYLSIVPGMAVFLLRIETDFAEAYDGFYSAVRGNATLPEIQALGVAMVVAIRDGLFQIIRVQGVTILLLYLLGPTIMGWLGISQKYVYLFYIDLVGVGAQVLVLAILNVFFYLDKLRHACVLTLLLLISNIAFTCLSLHLGPQWYGYGFGISMTLSALVGLVLLSREMTDIEYRTFMRVRVVDPSPISNDATTTPGTP